MKEYLEELIEVAENTDDKDTLSKISDTFWEISEYANKLRQVGHPSSVSDFACSVDSAMEDIYATAMDYSAKVKLFIDEVEQEEQDEEYYGSYEEQAKRAYRASAL